MQALFPFTKFLPPQLDDRVVVGGAVEQLRRAVAAHPLTVVTAPAGSGKTTAVASWARDAGGPVAWVRMSRADDTAAAAAAAVLTGVRRVVAGFGTRLDQVLSQAETSASTPHLVTSLVNDLGETVSLRLVLDDFHEITSPDGLALFDALADHLPPGNRLVVASRTEPALSLPRRRVRGELAELTLEDLRLDHASIGVVLARDDAATDGVVAAVARATNGWPAAVQLAAAWIAAGVGDVPSEDPMGPIQAHLWRFLAEEVLDAQPEDLRTFLLDTAILDEMTPSVCAHVSTRPDAAALLAEVDRRRLFLTRYTGEGGQVWRY
ncbi:MAG TPA: AAA family ATPase, partial [Euzebyales bacterium]|nr:AAA family ATPase [Euzebyales bacterium]